jgi:prepilin-type N-terminal cleavage/methylation domain-containing protein
MLNKLKQQKESGFTIIEVMIVLAIAGLIMVVVFLAVPALQRSGRNNARTADVTNILGAAGEYVSNNGGSIGFANTDLTGETKLGYYTAANVTVVTKVAGTDVTAPTTADTVVIAKNAKCGASPTDKPVNGTTRSYVAYYAVETSGSIKTQCQG